MRVQSNRPGASRRSAFVCGCCLSYMVCNVATADAHLKLLGVFDCVGGTHSVALCAMAACGLASLARLKSSTKNKFIKRVPMRDGDCSGIAFGQNEAYLKSSQNCLVVCTLDSDVVRNLGRDGDRAQFYDPRQVAVGSDGYCTSLRTPPTESKWFVQTH